MSRKMIGIALIALGDVVLIVALAADSLGLGMAPGTIGYKQITMAVVGIIIQVAGIILSQAKAKA